MRIVEGRGFLPAEPMADGATDLPLAHRPVPPTVVGLQLPRKKRESVLREGLVRQLLPIHRPVPVAGEVRLEVAGKLGADVLLPVFSPLQVQNEGLHLSLCFLFAGEKETETEMK